VRELLADAPESPETLELRINALRFILVSASNLGLEEAELARLLEEGNALLSRSGDARAHALFLLGTGAALTMAGRLRAGLPAYYQSVARADETGDAELRALGRTGLAFAHAAGGSSDRALAFTEEAIEILGGAAAAEANPSLLNPYHRLLWLRGVALAFSGRLGEAQLALERALELATERGDLVSASTIHSFRAYLEGLRGSHSSALARARQSVERGERVGVPMSLAYAYHFLGQAHLDNGQIEEARVALEHALAIALGFNLTKALGLGLLAEACAGLGDTARAREAAAEAVAVAEREGVRYASIWISLARVLRSTDGLAAEREIEATLGRALELVEETGARIFVPQVHEERAELARLRGDDTTHERELREAHRLYTEMGATGHAKRLAEKLEL
jgi:tetratricopeptide (TPR) repeat protein